MYLPMIFPSGERYSTGTIGTSGNADCVGTKMDVVSCRPAIVATAGTNYTNDPMASSAESCAIGTLKALGKVNITAGSFYHVVQNWFLQIICESIAKKVGDFKIDGVGKNK